MPAISIGDNWTGFSDIHRLVVFGASYCDVGYNSSSPHPTPHEPLGVPFPGYTWCEATDKPNWVGHLVAQTKSQREIPLLIYDYALGGDTVEGVRRQVHRHFLPQLAHKPEWAPWTPSDTLFITWVGINDCARDVARRLDPDAAAEARLKVLFEAQERVYEAGGRNFGFVDVPPTYDFPEGLRSQKAQTAVSVWNRKLTEACQTFASCHPDSTVLIWSSWRLFHNVLTDPESFGFQPQDVTESSGRVFVDGLHPTSAMHEIIAAQLLNFLMELSPTLHKNHESS